jgi:hypothetical protein
MTTPPTTNCPQCGAPLKRVLCEYCGTLGLAHPLIDEQRQALEVFHGLLATKDQKTQINLLKNGFLPDDRDVLIEAGLRCVALLGNDETGDLEEAVVGRLRAVSAKLHLRPTDETTQKALASFDGELKRFKRNDRNAVLLGLSMLVGIVLLCVCLVLVTINFWPK